MSISTQMEKSRNTPERRVSTRSNDKRAAGMRSRITTSSSLRSLRFPHFFFFFIHLHFLNVGASAAAGATSRGYTTQKVLVFHSPYHTIRNQQQS
ncbi:hypothetical protein OUZ56_030124 [Daphnia magna]|uniref:Uncharacterized protein n=1 Tax=Daphnia magna TaxID=35525 RepID=A0ABQ9ZQC3_9CRUS|nr:hypothetical protein OUZ56_030124 [Daphnia magna]